MNASLRNNEIEISFSSGIGYGMCFLSLYIGTYYNIILSWYIQTFWIVFQNLILSLLYVGLSSTSFRRSPRACPGPLVTILGTRRRAEDSIRRTAPSSGESWPISRSVSSRRTSPLTCGRTFLRPPEMLKCHRTNSFSESNTHSTPFLFDSPLSSITVTSCLTSPMAFMTSGR